jgi:taurine dioxygenase
MSFAEAGFERAAVQKFAPFGLEIEFDLTHPLDEAGQRAFRNLFYREKPLVFRNQKLDEEAQIRVLGYLGRVLGARGEYREISSDGNLGAGPLCYHSDLSFTDEPFKVLSLYALEVLEGGSWTSFADGIAALRALPEELRRKVEALDAVAGISATQTHRAIA